MDCDKVVPLSEAVLTEEHEAEALLTRSDVLQGKRLYEFFARVRDILFSLLAMIALSPLFAVFALLIYIDDPHGSPIFVQERIGLQGKVFRFYKFRSMVVNAEAQVADLQSLNEKDGPMFKIKDDPRITRIGHFIRKTGLDELPQFWNILKGDMAIVGPRPCLPREFVHFNDYQKQKTLVKPGLTCYWQIQPNRDDVNFLDWIDLDLRYIRERSFLTDWKMIFATIGTVLHGNGQ